jgi:Uma2 family endonuclease
MATVARVITADDLFRMPADGMRHELIRGELTSMAPAGFEHGVVGGGLYGPLYQHVSLTKAGVLCLAETGFILERNPDTVRAADIAFVANEKLERIGLTKKYFPEAPNLAVEVLSPSDTVNDVDEKVQQWLAAGTELVWVLNPRQRSVTVYAQGAKPIILTSADELEGGKVLPSFRLPVRDIFPAE